MVLQFKSILDLLKAFPTEQACIDHLTKLRWNGNVVSPFDADSTVYVCKGNKYKCKSTGKYFNVRTATIFEDTKMPLQKWFMALYIFSSHKKGISSHQLSRDLDITQKSAWFLLHRLRYAFEHPAFRAIVGGDGEPVQADETFIGGKEGNKHQSAFTKRQKANEKRENDKLGIHTASNRGRSVETKTPVLGIISRGVVIASAAPDTKSETLKAFINWNVVKGATLVTDEYHGYTKLGRDYTHETIQHKMGEYVRNGFHTNSIEGFWSQMKRGIYGIYHHVSATHLNAYCDEFTYRYNTRSFTTQHRFDMILTNVSGRRLTYETLTTK
ncbi:MAG: IS1595 family transposase [Bacteroidetes bacterium]|nr:IS1595 family transposase [Bacteroidota bacterium]